MRHACLVRQQWLATDRLRYVSLGNKLLCARQPQWIKTRTETRFGLLCSLFVPYLPTCSERLQVRFEILVKFNTNIAVTFQAISEP